MIFACVKALRKLHHQELSTNKPSFACLFEKKLADLLVSLLSYTQYPELLFEICWTLTNLTSGENGEVEALLEIPDLLTHLNHLVRLPFPEQSGEIISDTKA